MSYLCFAVLFSLLASLSAVSPGSYLFSMSTDMLEGKMFELTDPKKTDSSSTSSLVTSFSDTQPSTPTLNHQRGSRTSTVSFTSSNIFLSVEPSKASLFESASRFLPLPALWSANTNPGSPLSEKSPPPQLRIHPDESGADGFFPVAAALRAAVHQLPICVHGPSSTSLPSSSSCGESKARLFSLLRQLVFAIIPNDDQTLASIMCSVAEVEADLIASGCPLSISEKIGLDGEVLKPLLKKTLAPWAWLETSKRYTVADMQICADLEGILSTAEDENFSELAMHFRERTMNALAGEASALWLLASPKLPESLVESVGGGLKGFLSLIPQETELPEWVSDALSPVPATGVIGLVGQVGSLLQGSHRLFGTGEREDPMKYTEILANNAIFGLRHDIDIIVSLLFDYKERVENGLAATSEEEKSAEYRAKEASNLKELLKALLDTKAFFKDHS